MDLIRDNRGRSRTDPGFRQDYKNTNDAVLEIKRMFIAKIIGQRTLLVSPELDGVAEFKITPPYSQSQEGEWLFAIRACVDRRDEAFGSLDCDLGENYLRLELYDPCQQKPINFDKYPECPQPLEDSDSETEQ